MANEKENSDQITIEELCRRVYKSSVLPGDFIKPEAESMLGFLLTHISTGAGVTIEQAWEYMKWVGEGKKGPQP